jgi:flagellar biosynthetic protein FliP
MTPDHDLWHLARAHRRRTMSAMTTTCTPTNQRSATRKNLRFALHFVEMVLAMLVGMVVLGPVWSFAWPGLSDLAVPSALVMAADMTIGMALWMRIRRHSWRPIVEMSAAMVLPFLALLVPYGTGAIDGDALMMGGHLLMLPAMLAAMLWRHREYRH